MRIKRDMQYLLVHERVCATDIYHQTTYKNLFLQHEIDMLEYFLFYFAYALTLDDDDVNFRGLRRVGTKACFMGL